MTLDKSQTEDPASLSEGYTIRRNIISDGENLDTSGKVDRKVGHTVGIVYKVGMALSFAPETKAFKPWGNRAKRSVSEEKRRHWRAVDYAEQ